MNRLCHSSWGNLEAVINIAGFHGNPDRQLIHFWRERSNGKWGFVDIVSKNAVSGGSIIQNTSKRRRDQEHGDYEVVVLEPNGRLKHYTRDNTVDPHSGECAWKTPRVVNEWPDTKYGRVKACAAAPLIQSKISMGGTSDGTTLETAVLTENGDLLHYRCPQYGPEYGDTVREWTLGERIEKKATGTACFFQTDEDCLMVLVPMSGYIQQKYFLHSCWVKLTTITGAEGPAAVYNPLPAQPSFIHAVAMFGDKLLEKQKQIPDQFSWGDSNRWEDPAAGLPAALKDLQVSSNHRVHKTNPVSTLSATSIGLGHSPHTEVMAFHPCGTGYQDSWMILHWSRTVGGDWLISGVIKDHVTGMPL
ncbi:hypothetical protein F4780DRAFT_86583 [Xylariomycetidae sp. FL0641]|nr:hypothetical protein F4780DRAFT_86583 [Xylariomycetidae sp. FL0641]